MGHPWQGIAILFSILVVANTVEGFTECAVHTINDGSVDGDQQYPDVAFDTTNEVVLVVYESSSGDGDGYGIFGRVFSATGASISSTFQINSYTTGDQRHPRAAAIPNGKFVVTWTGEGDDGSGGYGIKVRQNGGTTGNEKYLTSGSTIDTDGYLEIVGTSGNSLQLMWAGTDGRIYTRSLPSNSMNAGSASEFPDTETGTFSNPIIMYDSEVIGAWIAADTSSAVLDGVVIKRDSDGRDTLVSSHSAAEYLSLSSTADGSPVTCWSESSGVDGDDDGVFCSLRFANLSANGNVLSVAQTTTGDQTLVSVVGLDSSTALVSWESSESSDGSGTSVMGRVFTTSGTFVGDEFTLVDSSGTTGNQGLPRMVALNSDQQSFVVVWEDRSARDTDGIGIFGRWFNCDPSSSPTPTMSHTSTMTATTSEGGVTSTSTTTSSRTASASPTQTPSSTATRTSSGSNTISSTSTTSHTITPTHSVSNTATPTESSTPSGTVTTSASMSISHSSSVSTTASNSPSNSASQTVSRTSTRSSSNSESSSTSSSPSSSASETHSETRSSTFSPSSSMTPSLTSTLSLSASKTKTSSHATTPSISASGSETASGTRTRTSSQTVTRTGSPSESPSATGTSSSSMSLTSTSSETETASGTRTRTSSQTVTRTGSPSESPSATGTSSSSMSLTSTSSETETTSGTRTRTSSQTVTTTTSPSESPSETVTSSSTHSLTPTPSETETPSGTRTCTASPSATGTPSPSTTETRSTSVSTSATSTAAPSASSSVTASPSHSATGTGSSSETISSTSTRTTSAVATTSPTATGTRSATVSATDSVSASRSMSGTPMQTRSSSQSSSSTGSNSLSPSPSVSPPVTESRTASPSSSFSASGTPDVSQSTSVTTSSTDTASESATRSGSVSRTSTTSASRSSSISGSSTGTDTSTNTASMTISTSQSGTPSFPPSTTTSPSSTGSESRTGTSTSTLSSSVTVSPSHSKTASPSSSESASGSSTPPVTTSATTSKSASATVSRDGSVSMQPTNSISRSFTVSSTVSASTSWSSSPTRTSTSSAATSELMSFTASMTPSATTSPAVSAPNSSKTATGSVTGSMTMTQTSSSSASGLPSATSTVPATVHSQIPSASALVAVSEFFSGSSTASSTATATRTASRSQSPTVSSSTSGSPTVTRSNSPSRTSSSSTTSSSSHSMTASSSTAATRTRSPSISLSPSMSGSVSVTQSASLSLSQTGSNTPSTSPSLSTTASVSVTVTRTPSHTPSSSMTPSASPSCLSSLHSVKLSAFPSTWVGDRSIPFEIRHVRHKQELTHCSWDCVIHASVEGVDGQQVEVVAACDLSSDRTNASVSYESAVRLFSEANSALQQPFVSVSMQAGISLSRCESLCNDNILGSSIRVDLSPPHRSSTSNSSSAGVIKIDEQTAIIDIPTYIDLQSPVSYEWRKAAVDDSQLEQWEAVRKSEIFENFTRIVIEDNFACGDVLSFEIRALNDLELYGEDVLTTDQVRIEERPLQGSSAVFPCHSFSRQNKTLDRTAFHVDDDDYFTLRGNLSWKSRASRALYKCTPVLKFPEANDTEIQCSLSSSMVSRCPLHELKGWASGMYANERSEVTFETLLVRCAEQDDDDWQALSHHELEVVFRVVEVRAVDSISNDTGKAAMLSFRLLRQPLGTVEVTITSDRPDLGYVSNGSAIFRPTSWVDPLYVTVSGKSNTAVDVDVDYSAILRLVAPDDVLFHRRQIQGPTLTHRNVFLNRIRDIAPLVSAVGGGPTVALEGEGLGLVTAVYCPSYRADSGTIVIERIPFNLTILDSSQQTTYGAKQGEQAFLRESEEYPRFGTLNLDGVVSGPESDSGAAVYDKLPKAILSFVLPPQNGTGYQQLSIWSEGGLKVSFDFYFTNDCPIEGYYFYNGRCNHCPTGAFCPGGTRVWPREGYWNQGEEDFDVQPCAPGRCLGGVQADCEVGYEGFLCGECSSGYFEQGDACVKCASSGSNLFIILFAVFVFGIYAIGLYAREHVLDICAEGWMTVQLIRAVGTSGTVPAFVRQIVWATSFLALDVEFLQPGCGVGSTSFDFKIYSNIALVVLMVLPLITILPLASLVFRWLRRPVAARYIIRRCWRIAVVLFPALVVVMTSRGIAAVHCTYVWDVEANSTRQVLLAAPAMECFSDTHKPVFAVGLGLLAISASVTVVLFITARHRHRTTRGKSLGPGLDLVYDVYRKRYFWIFFFSVGLECVLVITSLVLRGYPISQFVLNASIICFTILLVVAKKPYKEAWDQRFFVLVLSLSLLELLMTLFNSLDKKPYTADIVNALSYAFLASVVMAIVLFLVVVRTAQKSSSHTHRKILPLSVRPVAHAAAQTQSVNSDPSAYAPAESSQGLGIISSLSARFAAQQEENHSQSIRSNVGSAVPCETGVQPMRLHLQPSVSYIFQLRRPSAHQRGEA